MMTGVTSSLSKSSTVIPKVLLWEIVRIRPNLKRFPENRPIKQKPKIVVMAGSGGVGDKLQ